MQKCSNVNIAKTSASIPVNIQKRSENNNDTSGGTSNEPTNPASDSDNKNLIDMESYLESLSQSLLSLIAQQADYKQWIILSLI